MERKWEHSKIEKYAEKWWLQNGYNFETKKEWISKTIYIVSKDGKQHEYTIYPSQMKFFEKTMQQFQENWDMYFELQRLKAEAKTKGLI